MRIIFAGTSEFPLPVLHALKASHHELLAVYTQPDRPSGRGRKIKNSPVKAWAATNQVPIFQPENFKHSETIRVFSALEPDVMVVIAYGIILPRKLLSIPPLGCINVHASLLPRWRGASPIQHALLYGDKETGVTIMQMEAGMDTGPKITEVLCPILTGDTAGSLHDRLAHLAVAPLMETLDNLALNKITLKRQEEALATYANKISKQDAAINWNKSAEEINNQIRAFNPWPIAHTTLNHEPLRIYQAHVIDDKATALPGTVLSVDKKGMVVATAKKLLRVEIIQFPGGKIMSVADWFNAKGARLQTNIILQ